MADTHIITASTIVDETRWNTRHLFGHILDKTSTVGWTLINNVFRRARHYDEWSEGKEKVMIIILYEHAHYIKWYKKEQSSLNYLSTQQLSETLPFIHIKIISYITHYTVRQNTNSVNRLAC